MDYTTHRMPLRREKRRAVNVTLSSETLRILALVGEGNRSAGIEELARLYHVKHLVPATPSMP